MASWHTHGTDSTNGSSCLTSAISNDIPGPDRLSSILLAVYVRIKFKTYISDTKVANFHTKFIREEASLVLELRTGNTINDHDEIYWQISCKFLTMYTRFLKKKS